MIDFVPLSQYYPVFINILLVITLLTILHLMVLKVEASKNVGYLQWIGLLIFIFAVFYIGLRPVSGRYFGDMRTYATYYTYYSNGGQVFIDKDVFFHEFMYVCSAILPMHGFFLLCAFLYVFPMYKFSKVYFKEYWFYGFLMFIVSFSFWSYGTNGIRNGLATSLFLLALSYRDKKVIMYACFAVSYFFHQTLILPLLAYLITAFYNKPKTFMWGWALAIPMSIALGGFWQSLFAGLGFAEDRMGAYLMSQDDANITGGASSGFRYDFLLYSAMAVFNGWYFIFKKKFDDTLYLRLFNTYLIVNAFWILVIRANFSNRFAYLSWFLMAVIIIYPFLKAPFISKVTPLMSKVILAYFAFTYFMYFVYY